MAKKVNRSVDEIDLTTFAWINAGEDPDKGVPGCGGCHPGGGGLEFDRDGRRYDRRATEDPSVAASPDGDYYLSRWQDTGVIEADCFLCHLPGYDYKARLRQLNRQNFQWALIAGTGIGSVEGAVKHGQTPRTTYNKRLFNEDGKIVLDLYSRPTSDNCLFCHGRADMLKRGFSWNDWGHDVHNLHKLDCVNCHQGNLDHNLAKGDENTSTVRDDLDGSMLTCRECHTKGYMGARLPSHTNIRPNHLEKLGCELCHIPQLNRAAAQGLCVSSGQVVTYPKGAARSLGAEQTWKPDYALSRDGLLKPVNRFEANLYTNLENDGLHHPLFAREIESAYDRVGHLLGNGGGGPAPIVKTGQQIWTMLAALEETLKEHRRFEQIRPAYHYRGRRYFLDGKGVLSSEPDRTWVAQEAEKGFSISHNIAPTRLALGAEGCGDCHERSAHLFESWIADSPGGRTESGDRLAASGLRISSPTIYLEGLHQYNALKWYLCATVFLLVFGLALVLSRERTAASSKVPLVQALYTDLVALLRRGALLLLAFTGYLFFSNNLPLLELVFHRMSITVYTHIAAGLALVACSVCDVLRAPPKRQRLDGALLGVLLLSGTALCLRERFGLELRYGLAVVHASGALVLISWRVARCYRAALLRRTRQRLEAEGPPARAHAAEPGIS